MSTSQHPVQHGPVALENVASFMAMTVRLVDRAPHLPGFGVCHGPSGYGKTYASIYAQNKTKAVRVEVGDSWSRGTLLRAILREYGEAPKGRMPTPIAASLSFPTHTPVKPGRRVATTPNSAATAITTASRSRR